MLKSTVAVLTYTIAAADDIQEGQLVNFADAAAKSTDEVQGVAMHDAKKGEALRITASGLVDLVAGATIAKGQKLAANDTAKPVAIAAGAASFGIALNDAAVGGRVSVLIR